MNQNNKGGIQMELQGWMGGLYKYSEWFMRYFYVNVLWMLFTLLGLGLFGWAPASAAAYSTFRQWYRKDHLSSTFKYFWQVYRKEFFQANLFGWIYTIIAFIFIVDLRFFQAQDSIVFYFLFYFFVAMFLIFLVAFIFIFPVYVHYDLKKKREFMKYSLFIPLSYPLHILLMIGVAVGIYFLYMKIPILLIFFGVSPFIGVFMWFALRIFGKIEEVAKEAEEEEQ